jgi:RNA polymerase sigma-54 factor
MRVQFIQKQEQTQKLSLTPAMRQSLECLQLSVLDLFQYVQEAALENPMLEVELPSLSNVSLDSQAAH